MASTDPWWAIASTSYGNPPSWAYFQGTQAEAEAKAKTMVEVATTNAVNGPYDTKADAEAAVKSGAITAPSAGNDNPLPGAGASFQDVAHALAAFYDKVTDGKMWRSLGWLLLGVILMIAGVALLLRKSVEAGAAGVIRSLA
jgi:uncharacterized membrane protein